MDRIGFVGVDQIRDSVVNDDGTTRVLKDKCPTCPFRPKSSFNNQLKDIVARLKSSPEMLMQCHNTYPSDVAGAVCKGSYDAGFSNSAQNVAFIEEPKSSYFVLAV